MWGKGIQSGSGQHLGRCGLTEGVSAGFAGQQMCDYMDHSTSNVVGPSIPVQQAVPIHPEPPQPVLLQCPGLARAALATWDCYSGPASPG